MENTRNGRQTPLSPAGGSNRDCSVPGKRLMHQIMPAAPPYRRLQLSASDRRRIWLYIIGNQREENLTM